MPGHGHSIGPEGPHRGVGRVVAATHPLGCHRRRKGCNTYRSSYDYKGVSGIPNTPVTSERLLTLEQVFHQQWQSLLKLATLMTGSREDAEDVVQSAFVTANARWEQIREPEKYLRTAVINGANGHLRRRYRDRRRPSSPEPVTRIPEIDETWAQIRRLSHNQRAVVVLRFYEDLPLSEIAQILDRRPSTVRSDLRRALNKLRRTIP